MAMFEANAIIELVRIMYEELEGGTAEAAEEHSARKL